MPAADARVDLPVPPELDPTPEGRLALVNGAELYYEIHGQGDSDLVLLHGFFGSGAIWHPWLHLLTQRHRVILPDLRGHGRSSNPSGVFTHRQAAQDILALCEGLGVRRFCGIGASTGGMTLLHAALQAPEAIEAMVLIYATTHFPESARRIMAHHDPTKLTTAESAQETAQRRTLHRRSDDQVRALWEQFYAFRLDTEDMALTEGDLARIRARTLVVHGDRDAFFPVEIPVALYRGIPWAYLWILPGWGHGPLETHAEEILTLGQRFLCGAWEGA
jgi:pimeloyl-ACP methyl ester carboxylesterase